MVTITRILGVAFGCSMIAGWCGAIMFREYADYLIPMILLGLTGGIVGAIAGATGEIVQARTANKTPA